ncbi:hypothetical protein CEXT_342051, partial [Caerostris extrusa]
VLLGGDGRYRVREVIERATRVLAGNLSFSTEKVKNLRKGGKVSSKAKKKPLALLLTHSKKDPGRNILARRVIVDSHVSTSVAACLMREKAVILD